MIGAGAGTDYQGEPMLAEDLTLDARRILVCEYASASPHSEVFRCLANPELSTRVDDGRAVALINFGGRATTAIR